MRMDSQRLIRSLHASVLRASAELQPGTDPTTGLPGPAAVEKALHPSARFDQELPLAMFVITDMSAINMRFGRPAGDDVLRLATEYLVDGFGKAGQVHRWYGPSFLVLPTASPLTTEQLKDRARALARTPFTASLPAGAELKSVPIFLSWVVETLPTGHLTDSVRRSFDAFASKHIGPEALPS
jgi:GGDEF domain-containing protein